MAVVLFWLVLSLIEARGKMTGIARQVTDLQSKMEFFKQANQKLEKFTAYIKNPAYLEQEARIRLNYKIEGEEVAFVYPDKKEGNTATAIEGLSSAPNYLKWWHYVLGR